MKILIAKGSCRHSEDDTAIRTNEVFAIFARSSDVPQIPSASHCLHDGKHEHHHFGADALSLLIYRTTVCAGVDISDLFTISTVTLGLITAKESCYFNCPLILFCIPFFHDKPR